MTALFYFRILQNLMQGVLAALKGVQQRKRKEEIQRWTEEFEQQLQTLQQGQQNYYLLLLAEVYAVNLRDIAKAQECLRKVQQKSQLIVFEHRLRLCYFNFLEGDYEQAINDISLMRVSIDNSSHSRRIATAFFQRVMPKQDQDDDLVQDQEERNGYEVSYIRALRQEKIGKADSAKRILMEIFNKFGKQSQSIKYETAKHLLLLSQSGKSKVNNDKTYKAIVTQYEDSIPNKDYYLKKIEFLQIVLDILDENVDEEPINYDVIKQFISETLEKNMSKVKDKATKEKLKDLQNSVLKDPYLNLDFCYNFLGEKSYQQMLKYYQQQKSKPSMPKQSTLKPPKNAELQTEINKLKITHSQQQNTEMDPDFRGSIMTKVNMNSGGYQNRYFYFHDDFKKSKKLFFCSKQGKQSSDDEFYRLKGFKKLMLGKKSKALNRQECADFNEDHCFTLKIEGEEVYERNFYVQNEEDLKNWKALFHNMAQENNINDHDKIKKTLLF